MHDESGIGSLDLRSVVTLTIVGGYAFITGFRLRDVIGRALGRRQRNRMRLPQELLKRAHLLITGLLFFAAILHMTTAFGD